MVVWPKMEISLDKNLPSTALVTGIDESAILQEALRLMPILKSSEETGPARDKDGISQKKNTGVFLEEVYNAPDGLLASPAIITMRKICDRLNDIEYEPQDPLQTVRSPIMSGGLFSAYGDGDHYKAHRDSAALTILMWCQSEPFEGGDLEFPDFNVTLPFKSGCGVVFPSWYRHAVTEVRSESKEPVRMCFTAFVN